MTHARLAPVLLALLLHPLAVPSHGQDERVPLEVMRTEAEAAIAQRKKDIDRRVEKAISSFARGETGPGDTRDSIVALGAAALPTMMHHFTVNTSSKVLEGLTGAFSEMLDEGSIEGSEVRDGMIALLESKRTERAASAIRVLGHTKDESLLPQLRKFLAIGQNSTTLAAALDALGRMKDEASAEGFERALDHSNPEIRGAAVIAFGRLGEIQHVDLVIDRLDDRDDNVAYAAIESLESMSNSTRAMRALHDQLEIRDLRRVRTTIGVLQRIGNAQLSRDSLRKVVSTYKETNKETAKLAAIALYSMRDTSGRDELAKEHKRNISKNAKVPRFRVRLAEFYLDFGDYKSAVGEFLKAINLQKSAEVQNDYRTRAARCYARLGKFPQAADLLKKANGGGDWSQFANDPAFEGMREDRRYADNFIPLAER